MKTEIVHIESVQDTEAIGRVGQRLREGAIVAFPTETVYGLGAKAERAVLARLDGVKGREAGKRYSLHIGTLEDLSRYVPKPTFQARKLMRQVWPGPVTLIFEPDNASLEHIQTLLPTETFELLYSDGTIGIRYPDHPVACAVLAEAVAPIIAPSANPATQAPAVSAAEVAGYFDGEIDLIIDAPGGCKYRLNSTVVKVGKNGLQVLREGVYCRGQIMAAGMVNLLFVCTGNTCRSPMAEGLCRKYLADKFGCGVDGLEHFGYSVASAGVAAFEGMPASQHALEAGREKGFSLERHRSRSVTDTMIRQADFIFVMSESHLQSITERDGQAAAKCFLLDPAGVADPVGYDLAVYRACAEQIEHCIQERINELL